MNSYSPVIIGIASFAVFATFFALLHLAKIGMDKTEAWLKTNPLKSLLMLAAIGAVMVAVWTANNQAFLECWPQHKLSCIFTTKPGQ